MVLSGCEASPQRDLVDAVRHGLGAKCKRADRCSYLGETLAKMERIEGKGFWRPVSFCWLAGRYDRS